MLGAIGSVVQEQMKLERLPEHVTKIVVTVLGLLFALYCGRLTGEGQQGVIIMMLGGMFLAAICLLFREAVWIFIPIFWAFPGQLPALPLPFTVRQLVVITVFAMFLILTALKVVRRRPKLTHLDLLLFLNVAYLSTVLLRNPVGSLATNSERIGGRPYLDVFVAFLAYAVLSRVSLRPVQMRLLPFWMLLGSGTQAIIGAVTYFLPATVNMIGPYYTGISGSASQAEEMGLKAWRHEYVLGFSQPLSAFLCAWFRPLTLLNPFFIVRFSLLVALVAGTLITGFRSALFGLAFYFLLSSYIRRGATDVLRLVAIGIPLLAILIAMQGTLINLPASVQRSLSFLPGNWDAATVQDATGSVEWRVLMWKEMLLTDRYIDSKLLGDGFGFSRMEFQIQQSFKGFGEGLQDYYLVTGGVHSGPISAIRYVGYVGLALYMALIIAMARQAYRLIVTTKTTQVLAPVMFLCLPIIYDPIGYTLIFGALDQSYPQAIFHLGLLKFLTNAVEDFNSETVSLTGSSSSSRDLALQDGAGASRKRISVAGSTRLQGAG